MAAAAQIMAIRARPRVAAPSTQSMERPVALPALTGLRFVAAAGVVIEHYGLVPLPSATDGPLRHALATAASALANGLGYQGVSLFFVLSGFILMYSYTTRAGAFRGSLRSFYVARLARIYPVYLLTLALGALPFLWYHTPRTPPLLTGLSSLTLTQAWFPYVATGWDAPAWSLSCEAFFYLIFPCLAPLVGRGRARRALLCAALAWAVCLLVPALYLLLAPDGRAHTGDPGPSAWLAGLIRNPLAHLPEFVLGMACGRLYLLRAARSPGRAGGARSRRSWARCALTPLVLGALYVALAATQGWPLALRCLGLLDPLCAAAIYLLACESAAPCTVARSGLGWLLSRPALLLLGEASYALYLLHYPLRDLLTHRLGLMYLDAASYDPARSGLFLGCAGASVGAALLSYRLLERPARRAIRQRWG